MRAIVVEAPGGIDALEVRDMPDPSFGDDDVLIDVAYAGWNWADTQVRTGLYLVSLTDALIPKRKRHRRFDLCDSFSLGGAECHVHRHCRLAANAATWIAA